ncbi:MAG: DUF4374 domain-containing protein [Oleispira sp.]|nr:DUF4374 domain-containing protein [Oleispira sp.]MBL4880403.1 DUF4374 domain-containing protein [Oleispira sp.]
MSQSKIYTSLILAASLTACGGDSSSNNNETASFTLSFVNNDEAATEYALSEKSLMEGTITSQGAGFEQAGWNFYYPVGNTLFVSGYTEFATTSYKVNADGSFTELNTFLFDSSFNTFGNVDDKTLLATNSYWYQHDDMTMYTADAATGRATGKINYTIYNDSTGTAGEGTVPWPTALVVRDNLLYIPYIKFDDNNENKTTDNEAAYVAIFDYPLVNKEGTDRAEPIDIISDLRTTNIGTHGSTTGLITTDNGDLYGFSAGSLASGHNPASDKPSGILRIAKGATEFDADYFFNIEEATNGQEIFWFDSIGGNKVLARLFTPNDTQAAWSAFSTPILKLVIIDLVEKTITDIEGIPLHTKQTTSSIEIMDGKVYVSVTTAEDSYIYQIDVATSTAIKGAKVEGKGIKGFYNLYN